MADRHLEGSLGFPCGLAGKESTAMRETWVRSLGQEDPLEKGMVICSSTVAWRVRPDAVTNTFISFIFLPDSGEPGL